MPTDPPASARRPPTDPLAGARRPMRGAGHVGPQKPRSLSPRIAPRPASAAPGTARPTAGAPGTARPIPSAPGRSRRSRALRALPPFPTRQMFPALQTPRFPPTGSYTLYATMAPSRNLLQEQPTSYHARPERENPRPRVALDFDFGHPNARKPQSCAFTQIANWGNAGMAPARGRIPARRSKSSATFGRPTS